MTNAVLREATPKELEELAFSSEYAEYIFHHGDRIIGNGHALTLAMEDSYLWEDFLESIGLYEA